MHQGATPYRNDSSGKPKAHNQHIINIPPVLNILMKFLPFKKRAIEKAKTIFMGEGNVPRHRD